ncbi:MAG: UDP-N-acetylmuramoyl-tripeptide--D-alanyl-D-alanine ligase [Myxococcota bacterium]
MQTFFVIQEVDACLRDRRAMRTGGGRATFTRVSTDSRTIQPGDLFVALKGDTFDGHKFVAAAKVAGARGAVVSRDWAQTQDRAALSEGDFALWMVDDTLLALGDLARGHLRRLALQKCALTGSNGKTTTKEFTAAILKAHFGDAHALVTEGNLNNQIGVPQTAFRAVAEHKVAVFEMGMNHAGEIAALCRIVEPVAALITNVAPAHIGNFDGKIEGIAAAKGEIFAGLSPDGTMVVNLDDPLVVQQAARHPELKRVGYGRAANADVRLVSESQREGGMDVTLVVRGVEVKAHVPALGSHNALNGCAAAALATVMGVAPSAISKGLEAAKMVSGRLTRRKALSGADVIDDSYNANPASVRAAMEVARREADAGKQRLILVLGDMLELGSVEMALHREVGEAAARLKPDALFLSGTRSKATSEGAVASGMNSSNVHWNESLEALLPVLTSTVKQGDVVLVKGSRGARMERAVHALCGTTAGKEH